MSAGSESHSSTALRSQVGAKSLDVYPVNYEASSDFSDRIQFAQSVVDGIKDAGGHIQATAANCPKTRIVLGGYSQGAVVAGFVTSASIPAGIPAEYVSFLPKPMPPEVANHVAAVTLFGKPSAAWLQNYGAPAIVIGPLYVPKTIDLCAAGDTICNGDAGGAPSFAHAEYPVNGMTAQAADFAASSSVASVGLVRHDGREQRAHLVSGTARHGVVGVGADLVEMITHSLNR